MKKIFLLVFVAFCSLIFYQIILGKNGVIEGYRVSKQREKLVLKKLAMLKDIENLKDYIKYLKNDPMALKNFANELGYFDDEVKLVKIIDKLNNEDITLKINKNEKSDAEIDKKFIDKIKRIRLWISVFFYMFFGLFIFLIIFGIQNKNE